jgi:hypothetical protein
LVLVAWIFSEACNKAFVGHLPARRRIDAKANEETFSTLLFFLRRAKGARIGAQRLEPRLSLFVAAGHNDLAGADHLL